MLFDNMEKKIAEIWQLRGKFTRFVIIDRRLKLYGCRRFYFGPVDKGKVWTLYFHEARLYAKIELAQVDLESILRQKYI